MYVVMHNLYGLNDGDRAYFKRVGDSCFEFTWNKSSASDLTQQECESILKNQDWYCHQFRASHMTIEA